MNRTQKQDLFFSEDIEEDHKVSEKEIKDFTKKKEEMIDDQRTLTLMYK